MAGSLSENTDVTMLWRSLLNGTKVVTDSKGSLVNFLKGVVENGESETDKVIAMNCLSLLCHNNDEMKKKVIRSGILTTLTTMISSAHRIARTSNDKLESMVKHEEAVQLVLKLCHFEGEKLYKDFVSSAVLDPVAELCSEDSYREKHSHCCIGSLPAYDLAHLEKVVLNKELIAKCQKRIHPANGKTTSMATTLSCYDADVYLRNGKVSVAEECVRDGITWFDDRSALGEQDGDQGFWSSMVVTKVLTDTSFYAYIGCALVKDTIKKIDDCIAAELDTAIPIGADNVLVGLVCVCVIQGNGKPTCGLRGEVTAVNNARRIADLFLLDYGFTVSAPMVSLYNVPHALSNIRPQITVCHLKGLHSMPQHLKLIELCSGILCNVSCHVSPYRPMLVYHRIPECLVQWASLPNRAIVRNAVGALQNLSANTLFKPLLGYAGCCHVCLEVIIKYVNDHDIVRLAVSCLANLAGENIVNRLRVAEDGGVMKLAYVYHNVDNADVQQACLKALRSLVDNPLELLWSPFVPDLRSVKTASEVADCSHKISFLGKENDLSPGEMRLLSREEKRLLVNQRSAADVQAGRGNLSSLSLQQYVALQGKRHGSELSDDDANATATKPAQMKNVASEKQFTFLDVIPFAPGVQYDFIHVACLKDLNIGTLSSRVCALLNCSSGGVAFVGVGSGGVVTGIHITRKQRDSTRLAIDSLLLEFTPRVKHSWVCVEFVPVVVKSPVGMLTGSDDTTINHEERSVIEIRVRPTEGALYTTLGGKCYVRVDGKCVQSTAQGIRDMVLMDMESKYKSEIAVLRKAIGHVKSKRNHTAIVVDR